MKTFRYYAAQPVIGLYLMLAIPSVALALLAKLIANDDDVVRVEVIKDGGVSIDLGPRK